MIQCIDGTVQPIDERSLARLRIDPFWVSPNDRHLRFDPVYFEALPQIHGGTPARPFLRGRTGQVHRIGWFTLMYDKDAKLEGPLQPDHMFQDTDTRLVDRSLFYFLGMEDSIYSPAHDNVTFFPFAALHDDPFHDEPPDTLAWDCGEGNSSLCFDLRTDPFSIVYCNFDAAFEACRRYDAAPLSGRQYDYSHLVPVADSFRDFAEMLQPSMEALKQVYGS